MTATKSVPTVSVADARTGASTSSNELGMRSAFHDAGESD